MRRGWTPWARGRALCLAAVLGASVAGAVAATPAPGRPVAATPLPDDVVPSPGAVLVDDDFGVSTREFGLDRQVQMYQWRRVGSRMERVWSAGRIDSEDFDPDHQNPLLPIDSQRWWARDATLAGRPIGDEVLQGLGEWHGFRPAFSRLPLNMAATFQPEGDGLGSAENPLAPQVGDLRITWRELHLPPLQGRVELRDGTWQLSPRTAAAALNAAPLPPVSQPDRVLRDAPDPRRIVPAPAFAWRTWAWLGLALVVAALAAVIALRRRR